MPLSLDAIEQVVNEARRMGFTVEQLNGIRAQLLMRSAQPDGAAKLELALDQCRARVGKPTKTFWGR